jgi:lysophospholipase L1-like esterase
MADSNFVVQLRRYLANTLTLVFAVAAIVGALELYVRIVEDDGMQFDLEMWKYAKQLKVISDDPLIGHEHRPNADAFLMGVRITTNDAGFRNGPVTPKKSPDSTRIMMLGDSVLLGWGTKQNETVSARLQEAWRTSGRNVEVINTGVGNYNTIMEVEFFLTRGAQYKPDVVVLNYFINDAEPVPSHEASWIERTSEAWVYYGSRLDIVARELEVGRHTDWRRYYENLYDDDSNPGGWRAVKIWIKKLSAVCRAQNIHLLIVNYPELRSLKPYPFQDVNQRLAALAKEIGVPYLDLTDALKDENPADLWVTAPDPHPNGHAHALFAAAIREWIDHDALLSSLRARN